MEAFYRRFLELDERIAAAFASTDTERLHGMMADSLYYMVALAFDGHRSTYLRHVREVHQPFGASLFEIWMNALLGTVESFDADFDLQTAQAWRAVLAPGLAYMTGDTP